MKHIKRLSIFRSRVASADILGARATIGLLSDVVGLMSAISALLKGTPAGEGNGGDPDDGEGDHAD